MGFGFWYRIRTPYMEEVTRAITSCSLTAGHCWALTGNIGFDLGVWLSAQGAEVMHY
ncbi:MAG: hypothetical protein HC910_09925 [Spirulinaceae cyanobacterium SM2_1_0]|nr:hypothetical protein [Spirulinaceae cyanobacterium SM2_1_0]